MAILLEENALESLHKSVKHKQSNIVISEAYVELAPLSILDGRNYIHFLLARIIICQFFQFEYFSTVDVQSNVRSSFGNLIM